MQSLWWGFAALDGISTPHLGATECGQAGRPPQQEGGNVQAANYSAARLACRVSVTHNGFGASRCGTHSVVRCHTSSSSGGVRTSNVTGTIIDVAVLHVMATVFFFYPGLPKGKSRTRHCECNGADIQSVNQNGRHRGSEGSYLCPMVRFERPKSKLRRLTNMLADLTKDVTCDEIAVRGGRDAQNGCALARRSLFVATQLSTTKVWSTAGAFGQ